MNPGSIAFRFKRLRTVRAPPARRIRVSATSAATSTRAPRALDGDKPTPEKPCFNSSATDTERSRGITEKASAVASDTTSEKPRNRGSRPASGPLATRSLVMIPFGTKRWTAPTMSREPAHPSTPPAEAITSPSASESRTNLSRPAPRAIRTAICRLRASALTIRRLATFVQAIRRTVTEAPKSSHSVRSTPVMPQVSSGSTVGVSRACSTTNSANSPAKTSPTWGNNAASSVLASCRAEVASCRLPGTTCASR